jgi:hypothetical protein
MTHVTTWTMPTVLTSFKFGEMANVTAGYLSQPSQPLNLDSEVRDSCSCSRGWDSPSKQGPNIPALFRSISVTAREGEISSTRTSRSTTCSTSEFRLKQLRLLVRNPDFLRVKRECLRNHFSERSGPQPFLHACSMPPASSHPNNPPLSEKTFSYPAFCNDSTASALLVPRAQ